MSLPTITVPARHLLQLLAFGMMTGWGPAAAGPDDGTAGFALGEVMVRFRPGTEAAAAVARGAAVNPPNLETLDPTDRLLSERTGVPVHARQLLSGGWVLFAVDIDRLAARTAAELSRQPDVSEVLRRSSEARDAPRVAFEVAFRSGSGAAGLLEARTAAARTQAICELTDRLGGRLGLPLRGTADAAAKHLLIELDLGELTSDLAERVRRLTDIVDDVQLNDILMPM